MFIPQGLRLVHSGSVTQANMKLASIASGAMIDIGVDWSAYAGNDAGSTPHLLILYDSAGNRLQGFIGASGGGETLGSELLTNTWVNNGYETFTENTTDITSAINTAGIAESSHQFTAGLTNKSLYKIAYNLILNSGIAPTVLITQNQFGALQLDLGYFVAGANTLYRTTPTDICNYLLPYQYGASVTNYSCTFSFKQVTDVSTNGVHLHSTKGGTNRNVASIDSAFDLNCSAGCTFKIYSCP